MSVRLLIETGSESHSTSSARMQAKFRGGSLDGKYLYEARQYQISTEWDAGNDKHQKWVTTVYELPDGTEIVLIGSGRTGPKGRERSEFHCIYRLDETAEVLDMTVDTGLRQCSVKGRLVLVDDILKKKAEALKQSQEEGF